MPSAYYVSVTMHVAAAMIWLGGMFFLGLVGAPVLRTIEPPALRQQVFRNLGLRFRAVGWLMIAILVVTGLLNLHFRGWLDWENGLGSGAFWRTPTGHALAGKLGAVACMLVVQALHDFVQGPRASRLAAGSPEALVARRWAMLMGRTNAVIGVIVLIAAVLLVRS